MNKGDSEINKILRELIHEKVDENINYIGLIKGLMNKDLKIEEIDKKTSTTKDNGYSAEVYNIKINGKDATIYEYSDKKAALRERAVFNGEDYNIIDYDTDDILIDIGDLKASKNVYSTGNIICLYYGDSDEIKESKLGESIVK